MVKIKDIPKVDRPREKFLKKGPDALSKSELLAVLIGSGIKGKNVKKLSEQIIRKFGGKFLDLTVDDLLKISGIGQAKALQIISAIALVKRLYDEKEPKDNIILSAKDTIVLTSELKKTKNIKFIDFCAGIGGGRIGLENLGMKCVGFSEIAQSYIKTYREFFGQDEENYGNLMKINPDDLPDFDLMIAGFPCQTFSVIGQRTGMKDIRGQIIFGLINIMKAKNLKYFILENVKGLLNHGTGESMKIILDALDKAGYKVFWKLISSLNYGVPQMRERIYFIGIRKDLIKNNRNFEFPKTVKTPELKKYLVDTNELEINEKKRTYETFLKYLENKYNKGKFTIEKLLKEDFLIIDTRQSDLRLYRGKAPTLRTGRHGILYIRDGKFRKLSGYESLLLQGFPEELSNKVKGKIPDIFLLSQAGNAMTVNVVEAFGKSLINFINE